MPVASPPRYLAFEAMDLAGKSTQLARVLERAQAAGRSAIEVRFPNRVAPGTGPWLDRYLRGDFPALHALPGLAEPEITGVLLAQAAFALNRRESAGAVADLLRSHDLVVADRSALSGLAYAEAMGVPAATIEALIELIEGDVAAPELIVVLDLDPAVAATRRRGVMDAFDRDLALQERVRASYRRHAAADARIALVDAEAEPDVVTARVCAALAERGLVL